MFAGVGERTREGNDLYREMIESGVIKLGDKQVIGDIPLQFFCFLLLMTHEFYFFYTSMIILVEPVLIVDPFLLFN